MSGLAVSLSQLARAAERLDAGAHDLRSEHDRLESTAARALAPWTGPAGSTYRALVDEWLAASREAQGVLESLATRLTECHDGFAATDADGAERMRGAGRRTR